MKKAIIIAVAIAIGGMLQASISFATTYYVASASATPPGKDTNSGTSASAPWTITKGFSTAVAGDVVNIKGGNYGHVHPVVGHSGTSSARITFQAQSGTGTPVLDGGDYTGHGVDIIGKTYVTLKGIKVKRYLYGIWCLTGSDYATIDGVVADSCCNVSVGSDGYGIIVQDSDYCTIQNCSATDNNGYNIHMCRSDNGTVTNCGAYSKQTADNQWITDYYFVFSWCTNVTVSGCTAEDINGSYKGNHGFMIKDTIGQDQGHAHSSGIQILNCTAKKFEECFGIAHGATGNTVDGCTADNTGKNSTFNFCLQARDGATSNMFSNCTLIPKSGCGAISVYDGSETWGQTQTGNTFLKCLVKGPGSGTTTIGVFLRNSATTTIKNCTMVNMGSLFRFSRNHSSGSDANSGTVVRNCIFSGITNAYETSTRTGAWAYNLSSEAGYSDMSNVAPTYSDFYGGFAALSGTGNISSNPQFASTTDFHEKSTVGRYTDSGWVVDTVHSPCIDAGDPADSYAGEPENNGNRVNMGRYGNYGQSSKSNKGYKPVVGTPVEFGLSQNVPNPFNPLTTISYTVAVEGMVTLKVYSASGQLVGTLVDEIKTPGSYSATWAPKGLASGVYFCKLQAGNLTKTNKMVFMK